MAARHRGIVGIALRCPSKGGIWPFDPDAKPFLTTPDICRHRHFAEARDVILIGEEASQASVPPRFLHRI